MTSNFASYACDECRSRKTRCSREHAGCSNCINNSRDCMYSRSGIIRRNRKRKRSLAAKDARIQLSDDNDNKNTYVPTQIETSNMRNFPFNADVSEPPQSGDMERPVSVNAHSVNRFSSNNQLFPPVSDHFWQDSGFIDMAERMRTSRNPLFTFEDEGPAWTKTFAELMDKGKPLFRPLPSDVLTELATHPEEIRQKAYLILFYGVMLTEMSSNRPYEEATKTKLRWNLWSCINDARLLLEPSDINIQALTLLTCHVHDFHTPSLCWMMASNACRMLLALGINTPSLNKETRLRRSELFWFLNGIDKSLALIFRRPPVFSKTLQNSVKMPTVRQLTEFQPHNKSSSPKDALPSLFGAHFLHRSYLLTEILTDLWSCLFDEEESILVSLLQVQKQLDEWYAETKKVLGASFHAEKPLLDVSVQQELQLGINQMEFHHQYFTVLLTREIHNRDYAHEAEAQDFDLDSDCIRASRRCLYLLDTLVSDSRDVYNGIVWQLLFQSFTPFFVLSGQIRMLVRIGDRIQSKGARKDSKGENFEASVIERMSELLDAMECLARFLEKMIVRHPLAEKLRDVANEYLTEARGLVVPTGEADAREKESNAKSSRPIRVATLITREDDTNTSNTPNRDEFCPALASSVTSASVASPPFPLTPSSFPSVSLGSHIQQPGHQNVVQSFNSFDYDYDIGVFDWFEWEYNTNGLNNVS